MKAFIALLLYRIVFLSLTPLLLLALVLRSKNMPAYRQRLLERLGLTFKPTLKNGVVIHASSVGEVIALKHFIETLLSTQPNIPVTVTTFTPTGSEQVLKSFGSRVQHYYLPLDNIISTTLFLKRLKPKAIVFMETELWPNIVAQCSSCNIPLLLINGRLSANSMRQYKKLSALITPTLNRFAHILTQSQSNLANFIHLGAHSKRCKNSGNLKYDISITPEITAKQAELVQQIAAPRKVWVVASTHAGDEALALKAFKPLHDKDKSLLLVLIPRHPERFDSVATLCEEKGFSYSRRSRNTPITNNTAIWLLDTLGELLPTCALADIVTMGGSFNDIGGHNPLEPALFKKPIIVGPNMSNFSEVLTQLLEAQAIVQLPEFTESNDMATLLSTKVDELLNDDKQQQSLGENAYTIVQSNQGASQLSIECLNRLIK